jgi:hypothetical protein
MNPLPIIRADCFAECAGVVAGMSTRHGGVSPSPLEMNLSFSVGDDEANVRRNREIFLGALNINLHELAIPRQVHSATVRVVHEPGTYPACDALITATPRVFLCVSIADCVPILLFDRGKRVVAGVHAGWRGTAGKIVEKTVATMVQEYGTRPENIVGFVGPSASVCCYEVGDDVAEQFDPQHAERTKGKARLDLKGANLDQLLRAGARRDAVEISPLCTIHETSLHSFRRDNSKSGRMLATIGLVA